MSTDTQIFHDPLQLVVAKRTFIAHRVAVLELRRPDGGMLPEWTPGSHIALHLDGEAMIREYSLCGDPTARDVWRIAVALVKDGRGGSRHVHEQLHEGVCVEVIRLANLFRFEPAARPHFVAGGIGITPILPMIATAAVAGQDWRLLYLGKDRATMPFASELEDLGAQVVLAESSMRGRVDLASYVTENKRDHFYCCGPEGLIEAMETIAKNNGVSLTVERFTPRVVQAPAGEAPFEVIIEPTGQTVQVPPDKTTLRALLEAGVPVPNSCGEGTCGSCEMVVLAGEPDHRDSILSDDERAANDCMFVCVSRSLTRSLTLEL
ncbi:PDR/VanB family oxidoreductase [Microbacterium sp. LWH3-1.2]|uniref:PDR/VanB family oxidoreductase n=1 Tax=Microbacterium sp. LWH3-1.2 TaxID=3135256 RepID=UPI00341F6BA2